MDLFPNKSMKINFIFMVNKVGESQKKRHRKAGYGQKARIKFSTKSIRYPTGERLPWLNLHFVVGLLRLLPSHSHFLQSSKNRRPVKP